MTNTPPSPTPSTPVAIRIFQPWEVFLSLTGIVLCIIFGTFAVLGFLGDWAIVWSPASAIIGLLLHLIFMVYRVISYMTALIFEVSPAIQGSMDVLRGVFKGRVG